MIKDLIENDPLLASLFEKGLFTQVQIDCLLVHKSELLDGEGGLPEMIRRKDGNNVSKGAFVRSLKQGKDNFKGVFYSLILLSYLGFMSDREIKSIFRLTDVLDNLRENEVMEERVDDVLNVINEAIDRLADTNEMI